jgi:hypothetical protein
MVEALREYFDVTIQAQTEAMQAHQTKLGDIRDLHRRHPGNAADLKSLRSKARDQPGSDETFPREARPKATSADRRIPDREGCPPEFRAVICPDEDRARTSERLMAS